MNVKSVKVAALLIATATFTLALSAQQARESILAIESTTVINVLDGSDATGVTVLVSGDRVTDIGRDLKTPAGAIHVDGTGKFLIPGLWDMHSHNQGSGEQSLPLYLANGVVGTRDMGSDVGFILPLRNRINSGQTLGPEIIAAGPILDDAPGDWPFRRRVKTADDARQAVRDLNTAGVNLIKVHNYTPRDAFFAIMEEARRLGVQYGAYNSHF